MNWSWISANQTLSENFIEEFQDFVDWEQFRTTRLFLKSLFKTIKIRLTGETFQ
jgi:hypothetical protein